MKNIFSKTVIIAIVALFCSCNNDDEVTTENCTLATISNFDGDDGEEQMQVTYTGNKITQLLGSSLKYTYEYDAQDRISVKNYYEIGDQNNADTLKVIYTYNADTTLNEEQFYKLISGSYVQYSRIKYHYTNAKITTSDYYYTENNIETLKGITAYTYTGNNITKVEYVSQTTGSNYSYEFTVDVNTSNPYAAAISNPYQMDTYIDDDEFLSMPIFINPNRVTSYTQTENGFSPSVNTINYIFTSSPQGNNLLNEIKIDSDEYYKFSYNCN